MSGRVVGVAVVGTVDVGVGAGAAVDVALDPFFAARAVPASGALGSACSGDVASDVTTNVDGEAASVVTDAPTSATNEAAAVDDTSVESDACAIAAVVPAPRASTPTTRAAGGGAPQLTNASTNAVDSTIDRRAAHVCIDAET